MPMACLSGFRRMRTATCHRPFLVPYRSPFRREGTEGDTFGDTRHLEAPPRCAIKRRTPVIFGANLAGQIDERERHRVRMLYRVHDANGARVASGSTSSLCRNWRLSAANIKVVTGRALHTVRRSTATRIREPSPLWLTSHMVHGHTLMPCTTPVANIAFLASRSRQALSLSARRASGQQTLRWPSARVTLSRATRQ
jgi:hypothetical protein